MSCPGQKRDWSFSLGTPVGSSMGDRAADGRAVGPDCERPDRSEIARDARQPACNQTVPHHHLSSRSDLADLTGDTPALRLPRKRDRAPPRDAALPTPLAARCSWRGSQSSRAAWPSSPRSASWCPAEEGERRRRRPGRVAATGVAAPGKWCATRRSRRRHGRRRRIRRHGRRRRTRTW